MAAQPSGVSTTPPSFVSSANLLRVHSNSSSRSLMKKLIHWSGGLQVESAPVASLLAGRSALYVLMESICNLCCHLWARRWRGDI